MDAAVWHSESHSKPLCPDNFIQCSLQEVIDLVRDLWLQLHYLCWALTETLPVVTLCCGNPTAVGLGVSLLHVPQQIVDGMDVGVGQFITLVLSLGSSWEAPEWSACQLSCVLTSMVRSLTLSLLIILSAMSCPGAMQWPLSHLSQALTCVWQGKSVLHPHNIRAESHTPLTTGPALLCCLDKEQGPLS